MLASRGINVPGQWGKEAYEDIEDDNISEQDLAAGVVSEAGDVVNNAGETVGTITEGVPGELVGNVVTATGDIVNTSGDVLGKALPLGGALGDDDAPKKGGWTVIGTVKGVNDLVGSTAGNLGGVVGGLGKSVGGPVGGLGNTLGGAIGTVGRLPGQLTKGIGLGGREVGRTPSEDPSEEDDHAVKKVDGFVPATDGPVDGPIGLKDDGDKETTVDGTDATGLEDPVTTTKDVADDTLKPVPPIEDTPDAAAAPAVDDTTAELGETKDDAVAKVDETKEETTGLAGDAPADITSKAGDIPEDATSKIGDIPGDVGSKVGDLEGDATSKVGDVQDEVTSKVDDAKSAIPEDVQSAIPTEAEEAIADPLAKPFETFEGAVIGEDGKVMVDDKSIGQVVDASASEAAAMVGKQVDAEGNIVNDSGTVVGQAELKDEIKEELLEQAQQAAPIDFSILKGAKVNKAGNLVNDKNEVVGRINEGVLKLLIGKRCDENGQFWNDAGKVIGRAEPIPEGEREEFRDPAPFEDFPDATVQSNGDVVSNGEVIGKVIEGDPKKLKGKKVDDDGDILDKSGNVIGKAERWEAPEAEPEPEKDRSILAGKRVNKIGNVVDSSGTIFGRLVEGDPKRLAGRMCDKDGNVRSESGDILGKAEVVSEGEREGLKEGPFAELPGCTVTKEGKVVTPGGDVVGRLISGDPKVLFGRPVDEDGDILDRNGNSLGKAERWEEPTVEKKKGPMAGRRVNREGNVVDDDGNLVGKLTTGELTICSGKEIDDDGDVVNAKGQVIGHVSLLAEIPPEPEPEPETESPEEKEKREQLEKDKKLAKQITVLVAQSLERIRPICKMITQKIEKAERTPEDERDEEALVKEVRPLIEEGGKILTEANGVIRGLDPDGRIQANAKHKTATREASTEEFQLADVLKELTGTVTECIDNAKRKIEDMPHAKKELNPLWGLLAEPLFQIIAAVGLLLNGVLSLVGRLLSGLGLGGIVDNLLGGLGLTRLLESLGVGSLTDALTGKNQRKKKK